MTTIDVTRRATVWEGSCGRGLHTAIWGMGNQVTATVLLVRDAQGRSIDRIVVPYRSVWDGQYSRDIIDNVAVAEAMARLRADYPEATAYA